MKEAFGDSDKKNKMEPSDMIIIRGTTEEGSCIDSKVMEVLLTKGDIWAEPVQQEGLVM